MDLIKKRYVLKPPAITKRESVVRAPSLPIHEMYSNRSFSVNWSWKLLCHLTWSTEIWSKAWMQLLEPQYISYPTYSKKMKITEKLRVLFWHAKSPTPISLLVIQHSFFNDLIKSRRNFLKYFPHFFRKVACFTNVNTSILSFMLEGKI